MKDTARLNIYGLTAEQHIPPRSGAAPQILPTRWKEGSPANARKAYAYGCIPAPRPMKRAMPICGTARWKPEAPPLAEYDGAPLEPFCRYFWTAEVISDTGRSSVSGPQAL